MIKNLFPAFLLIALTACQDTDGGGQGSAVPASPSANAPTTTSSAQPGTIPNPGSGALNPPHGEPGHVCEIPVGEPLDGSGGTGAGTDMVIPSMQGSPQEIMIDPSQMQGGTTIVDPSAGGTTAPGMNPPHGQPGHVCEIPVGEPLP